MESLGDWQRSCLCGEPRSTQVGQQMVLMGWVQSQRDHGGVTFVDLRDRSGLVQIVCNPNTIYLLYQILLLNGKRSHLDNAPPTPAWSRFIDHVYIDSI